MKYLIRLYARADAEVSIAEKHEKLVRGLLLVDGSWGLLPGDYPALNPGRELSAQFPLGKQLKGRGVGGFVNYHYRVGVREDSACDDYIALDFNPERVDFKALVESALSHYIVAFDPYFGYVADEEFIFSDFNRSRNMNFRVSILRVFPICFLSRDLCEKALGLSLAEVANRLAGHVRHVSPIADGLLIVGHTEPISFASTKTLSGQLSSLVGLKVT